MLLKEQILFIKSGELSFLRFLGNLPKNSRKLSVHRKFPHQEIRWKSLCFTQSLLISTYSFLLFLYTVSQRYKRDYLHASTDILFYIKFYNINMMKKHQIIIPCYNTKRPLTKHKGPDLSLPPPSSPVHYLQLRPCSYVN